MFEVKHLCIGMRSGGVTAEPVSDVSFVLQPGKTMALVGESGCGKSLTASALIRLLPDVMHVTAGEVIHEGTDLLQLSESDMRHWRGSRIAMVFQDPSTALNPVMTVGAQIEEVLQIHGVGLKNYTKEKAITWLKRVGLDDAERRYDAYPFELSGGQKQRVVIAMALAANPDVVIADEPTTALDVLMQDQILQLLRDLQKERRLTILLITHDLAVVEHYADTVALMYAGQIVETAPAAEFFARPLHPYAVKLLGAVPSANKAGRALTGIDGMVPAIGKMPAGCRFAARCSMCEKACEEQSVEFRTVADGRGVRCLKAGGTTEDEAAAQGVSPVAIGEPVLEVENLCVTYGKSGGMFGRTQYFDAVKDVSFTVRAGETLALVGESGSGKTTAGKAVLRLLDGAKITGSARIAGIDSLHARGRKLREVRRIAQIVFQDPYGALDPRMSVGECILEGVLALHPETTREAGLKLVEELLGRVGLEADAAMRLPHEFSGGQRQRVAIARALAVEPQIIVCDEPTSALDVSVQAQVLNLLKRIQQESGVALLFITHNFAVVEYMADTVAVMQKGRLVEYGPASEVLQKPREEYTRKLLAAVPRLSV